MSSFAHAKNSDFDEHDNICTFNIYIHTIHFRSHALKAPIITDSEHLDSPVNSLSRMKWVPLKVNYCSLKVQRDKTMESVNISSPLSSWPLAINNAVWSGCPTVIQCSAIQYKLIMILLGMALCSVSCCVLCPLPNLLVSPKHGLF